MQISNLHRSYVAFFTVPMAFSHSDKSFRSFLFDAPKMYICTLTIIFTGHSYVPVQSSHHYFQQHFSHQQTMVQYSQKEFPFAFPALSFIIYHRVKIYVTVMLQIQVSLRLYLKCISIGSLARHK